MLCTTGVQNRAIEPPTLIKSVILAVLKASYAAAVGTVRCFSNVANHPHDALELLCQFARVTSRTESASSVSKAGK
jgi:hypothetical protein